MTDEMMSLQNLLGKSADADFLREMIGFAAQRLMELEVGGLTGAGHGERNPERMTHRNGYREQVAKGRFVMKDAKGRTVIDRRATTADRIRLWLKEAIP